jgi:pimeloyl-ACP methyl ester carboxylesterase
MSALTVESDLVHYEVLGRGRPVIFVHGWLGSWRYWVPTMQQLSMKYRTYALDLWGFGDSGKNALRFGLQGQVDLLFQFYERLGIPKAALIGHSLGAAVALRFARQHPDRVYRMMLISPPLFDMGDADIGGDPPPMTATASVQPSLNAASPDPVVPPSGPQFSTTSETIPRNPFRTRAETPEELLARLRAKMSGTDTPEAPVRPSLPVLPTAIGRPILPAAPIMPPTPLPPVQQPVQAPSPPATLPTPAPPESHPGPEAIDVIRPLLNSLNGRPSALLTRHLQRETPDLETLRAEADKAADQAIPISAQSLAQVNLARDLHHANTPTLLLHGEDDALVPQPSESLLRRINADKAAGHFVPLIEPSLGHFPMLEITAKFIRLLVDFLEAPDLTNLQFKDQWRRSMR